MGIPLTVLIGQRGANGIPSMAGRVDSLRNRLRFYEHSIAERFGYEGMRCGWDAAPDEAFAWARYDHLLRPCEVYNPAGQRVWEGFLFEIKVTLGRITVVYSLKDLANRLMVRYATAAGATGATATFSNAESIALFGTRDRIVNLSGVLAASAAAQAQTRLNDLAFPQSAYPSGGGGGREKLTFAVELTFKGWAETLEWLVTSNTSTATVAIGTQLTNLIVSYNSTNAWFSTTTSIEAGLPSDAEAIEVDTTYREKFDKLLAQGNNSNRRLHWGFYDDRQLVVRTAASASPGTIAYYENVRAAEVRDRYGNVVDAWDLRPDVMVQIEEAVDTDLPSGAIDGPFRKYVTRVTCKVGEDGQASYTLEPGNAETLDSLLKSPTGTGPAGNSARQAAIERLAVQSTRSRFASTDNPDRFSGGVWKPAAGGTGVINTGIIDTGGGDITNTGGGNVDLGTGVGIGGAGSTGVTTAGGTIGALVKWTGTNQLGNAVAGTDYAAASHTHAAADTISGVFATGRLGSGTANSTKYLRGDGSWQTLDAAATGAVGGSGTAGRIPQWATGGGDLQDSTLIKSGAGLLTLSASSTETLTIASGGGGTLDLNGNALTLNSSLTFNSGTTGRLAGYTGTGTLDDSTVAKTGTGVLTLATGTTTLTLTLSGGSGQIDFTTPATNDVLLYDGSKFTPTAITSSVVSNFNEAVDDRVGALLVAGAGIGLIYNDAGNALTISNTGGTVGGTGTAGRIMQWASGGANAENSTLAKTGAGVLTLSAAGASTLTVPGTGTAALGTGANSQLAYWTGGSPITLAGDSNLTFDGLDLYTNSIRLSSNVYILSTQILGTRKTGWAAAAGAATRTSFNTGTVTLVQLAERVKALIDDLLGHGIIGA